MHRSLKDEAVEVEDVLMLPVHRVARAWRVLERQRDAWVHFAFFAGSKVNRLYDRLELAEDGARHLFGALTTIRGDEDADTTQLRAIADTAVKRFMLAGT